MNKDLLIDQVIRQIQKDCEHGEFAALEELLRFVPDRYLQGFLSEVPEAHDD